MTSNDIKWVFFDLDGTLVDTVPRLYEAYEDFMESHDRTPAEEEFRELDGPSLPEIVEILKERHDIKGEGLVEEYMEFVRERYVMADAVNGAESKVKECIDKGISTALVTSSIEDLAEPLLGSLGWNDMFSVKVYGDDISRAKPEPDIYKTALRRAEASPEEVIVVEDSENGFESARRAGLEAVTLEKLGKTLEVRR